MKRRQQLAVVTAAKLSFAGLNVLFVYLCSLRLPHDEAAAFFSQFSTVMLVAALCGIGAGAAAFSLVSPAYNRDAPYTREYSALFVLGLGGIGAAVVLYAIAVVAGWLAPVNPIGTGILLASAACTLMLADLNRSAGDVALSVLLQGTAPMLIMPAALLLLDVRSSEGLFNCAAVSFSISAAALMATGSQNLTRIAAADVAGKLRTAIRAAPLPAVSTMQVHAEIVLAAQFLGPAALGVFVLANRMATLVRMPALIVFRVFAPSMNDRLADRLAHGGDRTIGVRLFFGGALLLAGGLALLIPASRLGMITLPHDFYAYFAICAGIKLCGLLPGSPESVLVARGRFLPIYAATLATLLVVAAGCLAAGAAGRDNELLIVGLVSSWFVLQRLVMLWSTR